VEVVDMDVGSCDDEDVDNNGIEAATNPGNLDSIGLEECRAQYASEGRAETLSARAKGPGSL
jgi:hypothetical protein